MCIYSGNLRGRGEEDGIFTSPHLVSINERIQIGRQPIDDASFYRVFEKVFDIVEKMEAEGIPHPSYFEFLFGMGLTAFAQSDVEYIVLETGLGGRLDATNAYPNPVLSVITSVSLDHTAILGDTIEEIAFEKAGIIKEGVQVLFDGSNKTASQIIRKTAENRHAPCREITKSAFEIREVSRKYIAFSRVNAYDKDVIWKVPICGIYQAMNAEIAIEAVEYLLKDEEKNLQLWRNAVAGIQWKGRMEEASDHLIIDGAHNPGAMEAFVESVKALHDQEPPVIIFSAVADKKYEQMIQYLCEKMEAKAYVVTEIEDKRKVPAQELGQVFSRYTDKKVLVRENVGEALEAAYGERADNGYIYCLGSLYLAGMVESLLAGGGV